MQHGPLDRKKLDNLCEKYGFDPAKYKSGDYPVAENMEREDGVLDILVWFRRYRDFWLKNIGGIPDLTFEDSERQIPGIVGKFCANLLGSPAATSGDLPSLALYRGLSAFRVLPSHVYGFCHIFFHEAGDSEFKSFRDRGVCRELARYLRITFEEIERGYIRGYLTLCREIFRQFPQISRLDFFHLSIELARFMATASMAINGEDLPAVNYSWSHLNLSKRIDFCTLDYWQVFTPIRCFSHEKGAPENIDFSPESRAAESNRYRINNVIFSILLRKFVQEMNRRRAAGNGIEKYQDIVWCLRPISKKRQEQYANQLNAKYRKIALAGMISLTDILKIEQSSNKIIDPLEQIKYIEKRISAFKHLTTDEVWKIVQS